MAVTSKTVWLKEYVEEGIPEPKHFTIVESKIEPDSDLQDGGVLVEVKFMSVDPYLRGHIKSNGQSGSGNKAIRAMEGFVSGVVVDSKNKNFKSGDLFGGRLPFSTFQVVEEKNIKSIWKLTGMVDEGNLSRGVGVLGMPGSTAYAGITGILRPEEEGETIFISAASGAVGSIAGQIAKNVYKLKTVGSCGGKEKTDLIKAKFGYDHAIDYKALDASAKDNGSKELTQKLKEAAPDGIDMYFENVGGVHFDAAFNSLRPGGRIAVCGVISQYNKSAATPNEIDLGKMIYTGQRIEGFVCFDWLMGKKGSFFKDMSSWVEKGLVSSIEETFYDGVENWPVAFQSLFKDSHRNKGKVVVRI